MFYGRNRGFAVDVNRVILMSERVVMDKKETILLDACLKSVIDNNAFGAELRNGHCFVAFFRKDDECQVVPKIGAMIQVEMSPFDMSKGHLVTNQE